MIELERLADDMWSDEPNAHVIVHEDWSHSLHQPGFYVRDEDGDVGVATDFAGALLLARAAWGEVTLAPANRLARDIADGRADEVGQFLIEYLAEHGAVGIDAHSLANLVLAKQEG